MIAEVDNACEDASQWEELAKEIPSHAGTTVLEGWGHSSFMKPSGETGDKYMQAFIDILEQYPAKPYYSSLPEGASDEL